MFKKIFLTAVFFILSTMTVLANPLVNFNVDGQNVDIKVSGITDTVSTIQLDFATSNNVTPNEFIPSKDFKYSKMLYRKENDKTYVSIIIDEGFNIFGSGSLTMGKVVFDSLPEIINKVKVELTNIDSSLIGQSFEVVPTINITQTSTSTTQNQTTTQSPVITTETTTEETTASTSSETTTQTTTATTTTVTTEKPTETTTQSVETESRGINVEKDFPVITTVDFGDVSNHWAKKSINFLSSRGIIKGTSDNEFSPNDKITRAEFITLLARLDKINEDAYRILGFSDVLANDWFNPYVAWAVQNKITSGISKDKFAPKDTISREQMAVMIKRFVDYKGIKFNPVNDKKAFKDSANIAPYAKEAVELMQVWGIINGRDNGYFAPKESASRAEAAEIIYKIIVD